MAILAAALPPRGALRCCMQPCCSLRRHGPSSCLPARADATALKARNKEGPPLFNEVSAELIPLSSSKVKVRRRGPRGTNDWSARRTGGCRGPGCAWQLCRQQMSACQPASIPASSAESRPHAPPLPATRCPATCLCAPTCSPTPPAPHPCRSSSRSLSCWGCSRSRRRPLPRASWTSPTWTTSCASAGATATTCSSSGCG